MEEINNHSYSVNFAMPDLKNLAGWATFTAIIDIIVGALACLGIITAAYGIPQIIAGTKLLAASDDLKRYLDANDSQKISDAVFNLHKYFKMNGIATIIKIIFAILGIILYVVVFALIVSYFQNNFGSGLNINGIY